MKMPEGRCVKWGVWGMVIGAIIVMIIGFNWGGWVTGGTASQMAKQSASEARIAERVPQCLTRAKAPSETKKLAAFMALKDPGSYEQRDFVADKDKGGWANFDGSELDQSVAEACAAALLKLTGDKTAGK